MYINTTKPPPQNATHFQTSYVHTHHPPLPPQKTHQNNRRATLEGIEEVLEVEMQRLAPSPRAQEGEGGGGGGSSLSFTFFLNFIFIFLI